MSTSATTIRLDDELKDKLIKELSATGLSINAYFNMAARQLILQKKIPFEILTEADEPTEETRRALVAAEAKKLGIIPDDVPEFDNTKALKNFLDS
ncbi:DNA-damage-inducible protein J [Ligilactobacillus salitolerans]|uniref:DNA-damage-inducible protein J n=1 Tax=Ligilactobacillus salitolerans TaxID=1808352 RepID=A0A401IQM5_9LACO|nr:type II toxin-antitoxin system RelB/DinJ family antitoxin [Ligilactobacillus salitolerans]GBG93820.1 DNA-damage-inducible protein J [Ligilactobacillus salitolerans]